MNFTPVTWQEVIDMRCDLLGKRVIFDYKNGTVVGGHINAFLIKQDACAFILQDGVRETVDKKGDCIEMESLGPNACIEILRDPSELDPFCKNEKGRLCIIDKCINIIIFVNMNKKK